MCEWFDRLRLVSGLTLSLIVFVRTGDYDLLAGVLLAVTGCEAIFAKYASLRSSYEC